WADKSLSPELPRCGSQVGCCANTSTVPVHIVAATFATDRADGRQRRASSPRENRSLIRRPNARQPTKKAEAGNACHSADKTTTRRRTRRVVGNSNHARNPP